MVENQESYVDLVSGYNGENISTNRVLQSSDPVLVPAGITEMRVALYNYMSSGWVAFDNIQVIPQPVVAKYYYFNGQRIAMRQNGELTYLHGDHLGSTVLTTDASGNGTAQKYHAFGSVRDGGKLATDHTFTGQKVDGTGLLYYNARYYDPMIGQFISPDSIVPDPTSLLDYNRYMYVRGNPIRYTDPSGHCVNSSPLAIAGPSGGVGCMGGGFYVSPAFSRARAVKAVADLAVAGTVIAQPAIADKLPAVSDAVNSLDNLLHMADQASHGSAQQSAGNGGNTANPNGFDPNDPWKSFRNLGLQDKDINALRGVDLV